MEEHIKKSFDLLEKTGLDTESCLSKLNEIICPDKNYIHYYPRHLVLKLTSNCNLRCKHCFFFGDEEKYCSKSELNGEEILKHLRFFTDEVNILKCTLTGGEIFTSPILFQAIEELKKNNILLELVSNGTLINKEIAQNLAKFLNQKYDYLQISLDGASPQTNDKIRGAGCFEKTVKGIKYLSENGLRTEVAFTVNSQNISELADMYKLCKTLGVSKLNIGRVIISDITQNYLNLDSENIFKNLSKLADIYDESVKLKIKCVSIPDFLNYKTGQFLLDKKLKETPAYTCSLHCRPHHEMVTMFPNGDISLCYNCDRKEFIIGNLKNNSFEKIWANRFLSPLFQERKIENSECKNCKYITLCHTGCLFRAFEKHGTINSTSFDCKYKDYINANR